MKVKLKILIDNVVYRSGLKAEHGFSVLIETPGNMILFDTGQSSMLIENSLKLGIDLKKITKIVLSHGHYDHTGGLLSLLEYIDKEIQVYAHPCIFERKYSRKEKQNIRYIGITEERSFYEKIGARFLMVEEPLAIEDGIILSGQVPRISDFETVESDFVIKENGRFIKDEILDDISLSASSGNGNILITGCAHSGLINIIRHIEIITGVKKFKFIGGGFHLFGKQEIYVLKTLDALRKTGFDYILPAHCTGIAPACLIRKHYGSMVLDAGVGAGYEFDF
jgi:7,8-dihydropterin-6-yl-methyl-4-(beta-D-ribofuranosyl)aminobenzene 5'-phosphate synthase